MFKFIIDLTVSSYLTTNELLVINSIGIAIIMLSFSARLQWMLSESFHNDIIIRNLSYPVVNFVNRISYWGVLFLLSIVIQIITFFQSFDRTREVLLNISFLITSTAFLVISVLYIIFILRTSFRESHLFNDWVRSANPKIPKQ